jgi:hypothetical protein
VQELRDQAAAAVSGKDIMCAQAAKAVLERLDGQNG